MQPDKVNIRRGYGGGLLISYGELATMSEFVVNWEDPALKRWMDPISRRGTRYTYKCAFKAFSHFNQMNASALVDEALADTKKDPRERQDIVLAKLIRFHAWHKNEYPKKSRGAGLHHVVSKGVSDKMADLFVNSARSFYSTFGITVRMKGRYRLPRPRVQNKRMIVGSEAVQRGGFCPICRRIRGRWDLIIAQKQDSMTESQSINGTHAV